MLILSNLPNWNNFDESTPKGSYGKIYTNDSILIHLHQNVNINKSTLRSVTMNPSRRVDIDEYTLMVEYKWRYIYESKLTYQYLLITTDSSVSTNLHWWVNIDDSYTGQCKWIHPIKLILMNITQWIDMNVSTLKSQYQLICSNWLISKNLHQWVNINASTSMIGISEYIPSSSYWLF